MGSVKMDVYDQWLAHNRREMRKDILSAVFWFSVSGLSGVAMALVFLFGR